MNASSVAANSRLLTVREPPKIRPQIVRASPANPPRGSNLTEGRGPTRQREFVILCSLRFAADRRSKDKVNVRKRHRVGMAGTVLVVSAALPAFNRLRLNHRSGQTLSRNSAATLRLAGCLLTLARHLAGNASPAPMDRPRRRIAVSVRRPARVGRPWI